jgi:hypothetical protein
VVLAVAEEAVVVGEAEEAEDASVEKEEAVDEVELAEPGEQRLPL